MAFRLIQARASAFAGRDRRVRLKPEEQELAQKQEEQSGLELELASRELQLANLLAELAAFERRYLHFVASRYAELDKWKARSTGPPAGQSRQDDRSQQAGEGVEQAAEWRVFHASPGMKQLYREVARRIHPDLTSDRADRARREQLMAEANLAYERGDQAKLEKILTAYEASPESVAGEGPVAELIRTIRKVSQIRARIVEIEAELDELVGSDLYRLKSRVEEAQQSGRDLIWEMVARVEEQIALAKQRVPSSNSFVPW